MNTDKIKLNLAIENAIKKIDSLVEKMGDYYPAPVSQKNRYEKIDNNYWTTGFFPGMIMLAYEYTKDIKYQELAYGHVKNFAQRLADRTELDTHDIGFLYYLSCVKYYTLFGDDFAKRTAIESAILLSGRYHKKAGIIQAWGNLSDPIQRGRMIIDCNMNLPLLVFAAGQGEDEGYLYDMAYTHVKNAQKYIVRDDFSTFHTYHFDTDTGEALYGTTQQGYSDDSCWARGQAWAVYGFALAAGYSMDESLLTTAAKCADYFLEHLPDDKVCYWDLIFTEGDEEKDSSAAAILACGLLETARELKGDKGRKYHDAALEIANSLIDKYSVSDESADGLILHSVYSKPDNKGIDECTTWGDYYYMELLIRLHEESETGPA